MDVLSGGVARVGTRISARDGNAIVRQSIYTQWSRLYAADGQETSNTLGRAASIVYAGYGNTTNYINFLNRNSEVRLLH